MNVASGSEKTPKNNIKQRLNIFGPDSPPQIWNWELGTVLPKSFTGAFSFNSCLDLFVKLKQIYDSVIELFWEDLWPPRRPLVQLFFDGGLGALNLQ